MHSVHNINESYESYQWRNRNKFPNTLILCGLFAIILAFIFFSMNQDYPSSANYALPVLMVFYQLFSFILVLR
jgi:hypothetical protein